VKLALGLAQKILLSCFPVHKAFTKGERKFGPVARDDYFYNKMVLWSGQGSW
jgi:hypothetical protein